MKKNIEFDIPLIVEKNQEINSKKKDFICIKTNDTNNKSDGIIFFKPEICCIPSNNLSSILHYFKEMIKLYKINLQSIYIISGNFLIKNKIIDQNYEAIKKHSLFHTKKGDNSNPLLFYILDVYDCNEVIGGLFLIHKGYSPEFLMELWMNSGPVIKIDDDFYGVECLLNDKKIFLVNGFFPYQIQQYKLFDSKIIFFTFNTKEQFSTLKKYFQGSVESIGRHKFSLRHYLSEFMEKNLIGKLTSSCNGIHLSASREEGIKEANIFINALNKRLDSREY